MSKAQGIAKAVNEIYSDKAKFMNISLHIERSMHHCPPGDGLQFLNPAEEKFDVLKAILFFARPAIIPIVREDDVVSSVDCFLSSSFEENFRGSYTRHPNVQHIEAGLRYFTS